MADTKISSTMDLKSLKDYVHDTADPVDFRLSLEMEKVLKSSFAYTQDRTHVISGSLAASGKPSSDLTEDGWQGEIVYGGELVRPAAPGPENNPVEYAVYEAARGPEHDPLFGLEQFEQHYENAISNYMGRHRG